MRVSVVYTGGRRRHHLRAAGGRKEKWRRRTVYQSVASLEARTAAAGMKFTPPLSNEFYFAVSGVKHDEYIRGFFSVGEFQP